MRTSSYRRIRPKNSEDRQPGTHRPLHTHTYTHSRLCSAGAGVRGQHELQGDGRTGEDQTHALVRIVPAVYFHPGSTCTKLCGVRIFKHTQSGKKRV